MWLGDEIDIRCGNVAFSAINPWRPRCHGGPYARIVKRYPVLNGCSD